MKHKEEEEQEEEEGGEEETEEEEEEKQKKTDRQVRVVVGSISRPLDAQARCGEDV